MDASEFKSRYLPCHRRMFLTALRLTRHRQDAEDIVQDAFTKLWELRHDTLADKNVEAYCTRIVHNLFIDRQRRQHLHISAQAADEFNLPDYHATGNKLEQQESENMVMRLIGELPEQQRQIITLRDVEGQTYEEIENLTKLSPTNIRVLLSRARKTIREQFKQQTHHEHA
ncbi:MAG: RNA polymerase sigma factor [Prevotella sp.]|nr:RNA polymerase sigma factor [Prevotella sp.]